MRARALPNLKPPREQGWGHEIPFAAAILGILIVVLIPLPTPLMDALLIANLTGSLVILLTAAGLGKAIDFNVFPSVLLLVTFFRLALNVATTRLILGNAQNHGLRAAGGVVEAFANFVAGNNLVVGMVVFAIFVVVQFVVITKGATRISEVAARFTLDAMPGRQLSIDNDFSAGLLTEEEAKQNRLEIAREAGFYGAMDGASKFVRGEAIAALVITFINILGGFLIGTFYYGMEISRAAEVFTRLTVGDGLVNQVPALMVSVATALLVTKSSESEGLAADLSKQLLSNGRIFLAAAVFLIALFPSGLPWPVLLMGAGASALLGLALQKSGKALEAPAVEPSEVPPLQAESQEEKARSLLQLEPIELELGYRLVGLVDEARGGDLMARLARVRERMAMDLGLVVPPVKVRDNTRLHPGEYSIRLRGNGVGRWRLRPDRSLLLTRGEAVEGVDGVAGADPVSGESGLWIEESHSSLAAGAGYKLRSVPEIIADHLDKILRSHAEEILTREEVSRLIADLRKRAPALVDELIPGTLKMGEVHKVLQNLLREQVSIRDLELILETLADHAEPSPPLSEGRRDPAQLTEHVRRALARAICGSLATRDRKLFAVLLDPPLEEFLQSSMEKTDRGTRLALEPEMVDALVESTKGLLSQLGPQTGPLALVCSGMIRAHLRELIGKKVMLSAVLAYEEVTSDFCLEVSGSVALEKVVPVGSLTVPGGREGE
jgi:flagellar biosynthesis protein FlhA